jgi:hypothetical protein
MSLVWLVQGSARQRRFSSGCRALERRGDGSLAIASAGNSTSAFALAFRASQIDVAMDGN